MVNPTTAGRRKGGDRKSKSSRAGIEKIYNISNLI